MWVNEGEEGGCVGERGRGGCMCGSMRGRRVYVYMYG